MEEKIIVQLCEGESNRNRCSNCKQSIPKDIQRLKIKVGINWNTGDSAFKSICGHCLLEYAEQIDKIKIKNWISEKVSKAI